MFVKQENIKYTRHEIVKNIKTYDSNYKDLFPIYQYKDQKQVSYSILGGLPIFKLSEVSNRYRFCFYRDKTMIEKTLKISFIQGISYSRYIQHHDKKALYQVLSIFPVGIKFQSKPMIVTPYFYAGFGLQLISAPLYKSDQTVIDKDLFPYISLHLGTGLKIKLTSKWYILSELTAKLLAEGMFINTGVCYQFTK